jgi:hypothetical protein
LAVGINVRKNTHATLLFIGIVKKTAAETEKGKQNSKKYKL